MKWFKERIWSPKHEFGRKSKRKTPNRETEIQIKEQVRKCMKQKGTSEETKKGAWEDKATIVLVGRHSA